MRKYKEYTILDAVTPVAITSSTDASPIVITKASHGLSTGARIMIFGHATNVAANGIYDVEIVNTSTFKIKNISTGSYINGSGAGAGSGGFFLTAPKISLVNDFRDCVVSVFTTGTATLTLKVAASLGNLTGDGPNFGATQSAANPYSYVQVVDLEDSSTVDGDTGIATTATDINKMFEVNINAAKYLTVFPSAWTQGAITVKLLIASNE